MQNRKKYLILLKMESKSFFISRSIFVLFLNCTCTAWNLASDNSLNLPNVSLTFSNLASLKKKTKFFTLCLSYVLNKFQFNSLLKKMMNDTIK